MQFIEEHRRQWSVPQLCHSLQVSPAGYYQWRQRKTTPQQERRERIVREVKRIHAKPRHDTYGSPRMHKELVAEGLACCENTVARLMKLHGIRAAASRKFRPCTTTSNHSLPVAPNRLDQHFKAEKLNQVWLTDFTYLKTREGFTYLCTVQDLCSRRIAGWAVSRRIDAALALAALDQAIALRQPPAGLIVHSDRGSQFASDAYTGRLDARNLLQSMSRKGNCYDNAPMESFFKTFKVEEIYRHHYETHEQVTRAVTDYIDRFYNCTRRHSSLDYLSPLDFETRLTTQPPPG